MKIRAVSKRGQPRFRSVALMVVALSFQSLSSPASIPEDSALWTARHDGYQNPYFFGGGTAVGVSPDGLTVFVTGEASGTAGDRDFGTIAYSAADGRQLWEARFASPGNHDDFAKSLAVSPDGSKVFVTGSSGGSPYGQHSDLDDSDFLTVAYSASTGAQLWVSSYEGPANDGDYAHAVAVTPDGSKVLVTGTSYGLGTYTDYTTVAYSASSGSKLWEARYNVGSDYAFLQEISPDGSTVFVTGMTSGTSGYYWDHWDISTVAYSTSNGAQRWAVRYRRYENSTEIPSDIAVSPDGSKVFVTGHSNELWDRDLTLAYSANTGTQIWWAELNGYDPYKERSGRAHAVAVSPDSSRVFVTLTSTEGNATLAYGAATGAVSWISRHNARGVALTVSPDGFQVFLTGSIASVLPNGLSSYGPLCGLPWCPEEPGPPTYSSDYGTMAFSASTGTNLWLTRYNGPANREDYAKSLAISPDGSRIFVAGASLGADGLGDFATVAYRAATSCSNGTNESGAVSGPLHELLEPTAGAQGSYLHGATCTAVSPTGL